MITKDKALELVEAAVAARGADYVYQDNFGGACRYSADYKPACIVGEIGSQLGVSVEGLDTWTGSVPTLFGLLYRGEGNMTARADHVRVALKSVFEPDVEYPELDSVPPATENAIRVLWAAQGVQDGRGTWGEALEAAKAVHSELVGD